MSIMRILEKRVRHRLMLRGSSTWLPLLLALLSALLSDMLAAEIVASSAGSDRHQGAAAKVGDAWVYRYVPGDRLTYRLNFSSVSTSDFRVLFQDQEGPQRKPQDAPLSLAQSFKTEVQAELTATILDRKEDSVEVGFAFRNLKVSLVANGQDAVAEASRIRTDLSQTIFAEVSLQGRVRQVRFSPGAGELSRSFARAILALSQFVLPKTQAAAPGPGLHDWESEEDDPNGHYVARYEEVPGVCDTPKLGSLRGLRKVQKTKSRYVQPRLRIDQNQFAATKEINPGGSLLACFDTARGYLLSLSGNESQSIVVEGKPVANAQNSLQLDYRSRETLGRAAMKTLSRTNLARKKKVPSVPLFVTQSEEASETSIERTELGTATLQSLVADLNRLESSPGEIDETALYLKLKALIYLHPESSSSLGKLLAGAGAKSPTFRILTGALGAVGHRDAQAALVMAIRARRQDWPGLSLLIPALAGVPAPAQITEDLLVELAFDSTSSEIASTAQLGLGGIARNLAETSPERAASIVDRFVKQLQPSVTADAVRQILLVLGNTGSARALPTIARYTVDPSPALRAAAVGGLRWIASDQVDPMLIKSLTSDAEAEVRLEAAAALGFREMTEPLAKAQEQAFVTDSDENTRLALLRNLWKAHKAFPEVRKLVKQASIDDRSQEVRKAAAQIVAMYPPDYFDEQNKR